MSSNVIIFRCDSSETIGSGHVTRCLALAEILAKRGSTVVFVCRKNSGSLNKLVRKKFKLFELQNDDSDQNTYCECCGEFDNTDYSKWINCTELEDACQTVDTILGLKVNKIDWLIIDHYSLTAKWEEYTRNRLSNHFGSNVQLMAIDDLANRKHEIDILLDQNISENSKLLRYKLDTNKNAIQLQGPKYALLTSEYCVLHRLRSKCTTNRILIYLGGKNNILLLKKVLDAVDCVEMTNYNIDIVASKLEYEEILSWCGSLQNNNYSVYSSLPSLAGLMSKSDLFIGAGGTTTWERICMRVKSLVITIAENQEELANTLDHMNIITYLGRDNKVNTLRIREQLLIALRNQSESDIQFPLVDGYGANRVANILIGCSSTQLMRCVELEDAEILLEWANDITVRKNSFNTQKINYQNHLNWLKKGLSDQNRLHYILDDVDGCPLGQIRFDKDDQEKTVEIDLSIDSKFRGNGIANKMITEGLSKMLDIWPSDYTIEAKVLNTNLASIKCFRKADFECDAQLRNNFFSIWKKQLSDINIFN